MSKKSYTIKEVSELSGVSARALRFYDEIGLLNPASIGENGYRYYENEQLLLLQQILFYRELGFELSAIKKIFADQKFDKAAALRSHRDVLLKQSVRTSELISTIDRTLAHLSGSTSIKENEMYQGFDPKKQAEYEKEIIDLYGDSGREKIEESRRNTSGWSMSNYEDVQREYDELHREFTSALIQGAAADSNEVQGLVKKHHANVSKFWKPNRAQYIGLGEMYCAHGDFRKMYDGFHPQLAEYLSAAIKIWAEKHLV
jgi:DNA-binding transcriptional MerR regulator